MEAGEKPWEKIPSWFYDDNPLSRDDVRKNDELRIYTEIQRYFGKNISPRAVNEFLFGDNIKCVRLIGLESAPSLNPDKWTIKAAIKLPNGNDAELRQTFNKSDRSVYFDSLKSIKREDVFPRGFPQEFFRRNIPALRELAIEKYEITAYSNYSAGYYGAYVWCRYGFTNRNMRLTLQKYVLYLEDYHCIYLDSKRRDDIMRLRRMRDLADHEIKGKRIAEEFLLGKRINCEWNGIIQNIFNEGSIEMDELIKYLMRKEKR